MNESYEGSWIRVITENSFAMALREIMLNMLPEKPLCFKISSRWHISLLVTSVIWTFDLVGNLVDEVPTHRCMFVELQTGHILF